MGVPLQLILGLLLALAQCSIANSPNLRQIREAPPPSSTPIQNVTEINNRDLNKIVKDNPKTETVDSKTKFVNTIHSYEELPLKLAKSKDDRQNNANRPESTEVESSKEDLKKVATKLDKEKHREENARAIDIDTAKFWSDDFHSKNVFTLPPAPDIEKFHEPSDFAFTRHPSFETNAELTTPTSKIFDQIFKESVESVEQNIEVGNDGDGDEHDNKDEQNKDADLTVEDPLKKSENETLEFTKTKAIVNNETVDKNSIHKDINFEQTKKINYEAVFNNTKVYGEATTKGETYELSSTERTTAVTSSTPSVATTRKSSLLKELYTENLKAHILSNNIETETAKPIKTVITSTTSSTSKKDKGELQEVILTTDIPSSEIPTTKSQSATITTPTTSTITTTTISPTSVSTPILKLNISDEENHVIPVYFSTESTPIQVSSSNRPPTIENSNRSTDNNLNHTVETRVAVDESTESSTTEIVTSTELPETTTQFNLIREFSDGTATTLFYEGTTIFIVENSTEISDATTELSSSTEETTTIEVETTTTESGHRTSKSLENTIVTEQMVKVNEKTIENTTKVVDASTESTARNELDGTTLNDGKKVEPNSTDNITGTTKDIEETTTEEVVPTSTYIDITTLESTSSSMLANVITQKITLLSEATTQIKTTINSTEKVPEVPSTTTEIKPTSQNAKSQSTTTEYVFVHVENTGSNYTTLLPEVLSPNLNYSTTVPVDNEANKVKKVILSEYGTSSTGRTSSTSTKPITSKTRSSTTPEPMVANVSTNTEGDTETSTENGFSKDGGGGNKGKIAAIAISSVGAVCLVLLAGLLYVMKKRQKRLNYGPRCRPVSLDDYSIDNLSVYNSVRRKGARLSKRSFGNPAFDDPVAPTHPLNFPALAKFSTNSEDIKAEFEEIPQISARTSELPDGCETKNRYANVIPLPETRVFLKPIDGYPNSDYINANYVTGPKNTRGYYIATQGPMQNTVDDFWRMIWEQQAKVILMLTHLVENGLEKCVDYLPESEVIDCSRVFGDFQIVLKRQEVKDKYIISTFQLKNMVSNSWREVTHFWYLGWPEKGVPAEGNSLIAFLIEARSYMKTATIDKRDGINGVHNGGPQNEHNPVVVHCSPGTGRTGVAIACDIAIREFETARLVDIPKIVYRIRRDRAAAVQTKEQYMFIYKVVSLYATKLTGEALENF